MTTPNPHESPTESPQEAIKAFHAWRRDLLLPGHASGTAAPDPELVLSSKMLKVFTAKHPEHRQHLVALQLHFLEQDYTNRVRPEAWREAIRVAETDGNEQCPGPNDQ